MYVAFFHGLLTSIDQYISLRFVCTIILQVWFVMEDDGYMACNTRSTSEWLSSNSWGIENASGKMNWYSLHRCISKISCRQGREFVRPSSWVEARMSDKPQILIYQLIRWHPYLPLFLRGWNEELTLWFIYRSYGLLSIMLFSNIPCPRVLWIEDHEPSQICTLVLHEVSFQALEIWSLRIIIWFSLMMHLQRNCILACVEMIKIPHLDWDDC